MSAALRLFAIESRRTFALWLVPVIVAASWLIVSNSIMTGIALWVDTSVAVQNSVIFAGPMIAAAAAWMAGREKRRSMSELLTTTPRPAIARDLASWSATACAGTLAYGLIFLYVAVMTMTKATWDSPYWGPIIIGSLAMIAHAATGYAFGRYIPSRYTAPVLATLLFLGQVYVGQMAGFNPFATTFLGRVDSLFGELRFLSPVARTQHNVFYGVWPDVMLSQAVWLGGVALVALALIALRDQPTLTTSILTVAALSLAIGGGAATAIGTPSEAEELYQSAYEEPGERIPYELVCADGVVEVCVHPAFERWLDTISTRTDRILAPVAGLDGLPLVAEQWGPDPIEGEGHIGFWIDTFPESTDYAVDAIARCALDPCAPDGSRVTCQSDPCDGPNGDPAVAEVIYRWLWQQAGLDPAESRLLDAEAYTPNRHRIADYVDRFAALSPEAQRAWLETNFAALQAGELTLDDLP